MIKLFTSTEVFAIIIGKMSNSIPYIIIRIADTILIITKDNDIDVTSLSVIILIVCGINEIPIIIDPVKPIK